MKHTQNTGPLRAWTKAIQRAADFFHLNERNRMPRKPTTVEVFTMPEHFPAEFEQYWTAIANPQAVRREMAAILLAEFRLTDPDKMPTDRLRLLHDLMGEPE